MPHADASAARRRLDGMLRRAASRVEQHATAGPTPQPGAEAGPPAVPGAIADPPLRTPSSEGQPWPAPAGTLDPGQAPSCSGGWVPTALTTAADGYHGSYGHATDLSEDEPPARLRWAVPWRLAFSAATVVALVVGATIIRATALAPGDPVALPTPAVSAPDVAGGVGVGSAQASAAAGATGGQVVVHVVGAVAAPGVVRLPAGARVEDAVEAAGGALPDAALESLNLARVLADGEQLVVPRPGEVTSAAPSAAGAAGTVQVLDLNSATLADLDALPGIGPVLAQRILDRRQQHRFTSVDELGEVSGIGSALLSRLRPLVRV